MRPTGPATIARIRATLRKAFNDALAREVVSGVTNPTTLVKTPNARAKPIVWEPERVARWKATGEVPGPVMVWTGDLLIQFLDYAAEHAPDLHPLLHFMAYRGPRRREACGLLDAEVRLAKGEVSIVNQIATHGYTICQKRPKSDAGNREVILDPDTVAVLIAYKARRAAWRLAAGKNWCDTGLFFVRPDGHSWHPNAVTQRFRRLVKPACHPSGCTTSATAPPPSPSTQASTSRSSPTNSATPPPHSPATPTKAWSNDSTGKLPTLSLTESPPDGAGSALELPGRRCGPSCRWRRSPHPPLMRRML
ncbi:hypothetical protein ABZ754_18740 [Micromonospora purpureochromogenes]|uniref:hypothetical protein n=1 Tax=Micromonospora purpureochromogenes TaxID=47872 RepID=UPI0033E0C5B2